VNGRDFLQIAQVLATDTSEAAWRSAVSRAYYAAFHEARVLLQDLGFIVPRADRAHAYLWLRLSNCGDIPTQLAGRELNDLRGDRNRADYDLDQALTQVEAAGHVLIARRIIQALDGAGLEPTRTAVTDAMKIYERDVLKDVTWHP
jgi:uncharacterized protein (UPF0332 family)